MTYIKPVWRKDNKMPLPPDFHCAFLCWPVVPVCLPWRRVSVTYYTMSTLDASGAAWQNTIELIIISDAVYTRCGATRQIPDSKLMPHSIYDILTQCSNDLQRSLLVASSVDTVLINVLTVLACKSEKKIPVFIEFYRHFLFIQAFIQGTWQFLPSGNPSYEHLTIIVEHTTLFIHL